MAAARGCPPAGSGDRGLAELLLEFSRTQYRAKDGGGVAAAKVERIERRCLELFGRDYRYSVISNAHGEVCAHYPRHIVLLERDNAAGRDPFESTVQVGKLQDLINRSKMARCRGRFVCPVILYKGKHICRSATLAGWGELYGRTGYNYIFSGGSDDAWADAEDISEDDSALRNADSQLFDKVRGHDIKLLRYLSVRYICDLMVENKKVKFGLNVTSSEKVDKAQRYADFTLLSIPYPGCEFFKEYKDRDYTAEGLIFNWKQDYVDAPLSIPASVTQSLSIDWSEYQARGPFTEVGCEWLEDQGKTCHSSKWSYFSGIETKRMASSEPQNNLLLIFNISLPAQSWDLVQQTQNYLKLLISIINSD
ncbi:hypothetical protein CIB84_002387, partial [Bambusicola thoracicus]